jgi:thioredoxin-related protein
MANRILILMVLVFVAFGLNAQKVALYNPEANATNDIKKAVAKAKTEGKNVFLQIGGNWCPWCVKFHNFVDADAEIKPYVEKNFVVVMVNYSPENKNLDLLSKLDFPQRFGFPVFVILDANGTRIHTQNSGLLEEKDSYNKDKVLQFFKHWSPAAIDPKNYK